MTSNINEIQDAMRKLKRYMRKYGHLYTDNCREYIADNFMLYLDAPTAPDVLMQIYDTVGCGVKEGSFYNAHLARIQNMYGLDRNIVEVGGGRIPSLAKLIALKQKTGTITVYDPRLIKTDNKIPNMTLKREYFTLDSPVDNNQLVMAFMPCDATEKALTAAAKNNADFLIGLCEGGPHGDEFDYFEDEEEWLGNILYTAKRLVEQHNLGDLVVTDLKEFDDPYPVIYNKRKNSKK